MVILIHCPVSRAAGSIPTPLGGSRACTGALPCLHLPPPLPSAWGSSPSTQRRSHLPSVRETETGRDLLPSSPPDTVHIVLWLLSNMLSSLTTQLLTYSPAWAPLCWSLVASLGGIWWHRWKQHLCSLLCPQTLPSVDLGDPRLTGSCSLSVSLPGPPPLVALYMVSVQALLPSALPAPPSHGDVRHPSAFRFHI